MRGRAVRIDVQPVGVGAIGLDRERARAERRLVRRELEDALPRRSGRRPAHRPRCRARRAAAAVLQFAHAGLSDDGCSRDALRDDGGWAGRKRRHVGHSRTGAPVSLPRSSSVDGDRQLDQKLVADARRRSSPPSEAIAACEPRRIGDRKDAGCRARGLSLSGGPIT